MCLALPAKIVELDERGGETCWVMLGDTRMRVSLIMTPEAGLGDWVLVHAGFAIQQIPEQEALETWRVVRAVVSPGGDGGGGAGGGDAGVAEDATGQRQVIA